MRAVVWPNWMPIASAPKSTSTKTKFGHDVRGIYVLGYCPDEGNSSDLSANICVIWWEPHLHGGVWYSDADQPVRPTHWMPLPPPPLDNLDI